MFGMEDLLRRMSLTETLPSMCPEMYTRRRREEADLIYGRDNLGIR
jgi:hypothetical protein